MRTFAIVIGSIFALLLLLVAAGWYWWHANGESMMAEGKAAIIEGRKRGAAVDEAACVAEVLERHHLDREGSVSAVMARTIWLSGCLHTSRVAASFCEGVPPADELIKAGTWAGAACTQQGLDVGYCQPLYQQIAEYCSSPLRAAKVARPPG